MNARDALKKVVTMPRRKMVNTMPSNVGLAEKAGWPKIGLFPQYTNAHFAK